MAGPDVIHLDFETRSTIDLKKVGAWAYAQHPSTEILCMGYGRKIGEEPTVLAGDYMRKWPTLTRDAFGAFTASAGGGAVSAHNAAFEYAVYNLILHRRYGWPARWDPKLWSCTLARAAMVGLPLDLDTLGRVLEIKTPKDLDGRRIMHQLCKPMDYDVFGEPIFDETPAKLQRLYAYNGTDVKAEMEVDEKLPELPESERRIWELDLVMNRRGVYLDAEFARKGAAMSSKIVLDLDARLHTLTGGALTKASRIGEIKRYMEAQGVAVPTKHVDGEETETLDKVAIIETLADPNLPQTVRDVLVVRQQAGKSTSTAKFAKALEMVCADGYIRGLLQYHAAHTGRWAGRLLQPHNFPKGFDADPQAKAVGLCLTGDVEIFTGVYGIKSMDALSDSLRGLIIAAPGEELLSADFNAIEARVIFWLAGEESALAAYRRGESPYIDMSNFIFKRTDISKKGTPKEYDLGKRTILGGGFGMGGPKFKTTVYIETAKNGEPMVLSDELADHAIRSYREKYASVPRLWKEVEAAAIAAVENPGQCYTSCGGRVLWGMSRDRRFLGCKLPSGRHLWYWKPSVRMGKTPWGAVKKEMVYWGQHPKLKTWCQIKTYGGLLAENVTQAVARDVMAHAMLNCEAAGFRMLLTVHDELIAAIKKGAKSLEEFMKIMCTLPDWAAGCPVLAEGWVGHRYRK